MALAGPIRARSHPTQRSYRRRRLVRQQGQAPWSCHSRADLAPRKRQHRRKFHTATQSTQSRLRYVPFNYGGQGIVDILSIGTSSYNALQMQYTQRGSRYLNLLSSYTYSRAIDVDTNGQTTSNAVPRYSMSDRTADSPITTQLISSVWDGSSGFPRSLPIPGSCAPSSTIGSIAAPIRPVRGDPSA